ncbi:MAG: FG-GAP-like repeat-containing protein, partial [Planctomycetes bacterium]|nr:FG-GAP-like repeat-containing protein [Planctomycetota bacterium]
IELAARDPGAVLRFYRDGMGMREVGEGLLEMAGTRLRVVTAAAPDTAPAAEGSAFRRALSALGFRYLSFWLAEPEAAVRRIEAAGFPPPRTGANVWLGEDPDGNLVEVMAIPRDIPGEAVTIAVLVAGEAAARRFYGETLGLPLLATWKLPAPVSADMHVFGAGPSRLKVVAPGGVADRPSGAAPGFAGLSLLVPDGASPRSRLEAAGALVALDGARLFARDPDGNRIIVDPAARSGPLFRRIAVPGLTDIRAGTNGLAIVDLDRDGRLDLVLTQSAPRGSARTWTEGETLRVLVNEGDFRFRPHELGFLDTDLSMGSFARGQVPNLADFDGDGLLDLLVTRHAPMTAGQPGPRGLPSIGNSLLLAAGRWDRFRDVSDPAGLRNETAYNRQPSLGDVNRDGWLDVAIGCDNIGNAMGGVPWSRLYVFRPAGERFADGRFEDIGGTDLVPDFGGVYHDSDRDRASPQVNLRDLDNDGDLDLVQGCHVDVRDRSLPWSPIEYRQGMFCWRNLLAETGTLRFEKVTGNGLACEARLRYDPETDETTAEGKAPGLPYVSFADTDNDGDLDVLAVGPASPGWAPRAEYVGGRFWRNEGNFRFTEATESVGLSALGWGYGRWAEFFGAPLPPARPGARIPPEERLPYFADAIFGDYDNDGWIDVVVLDRSEGLIGGRAVLFRNRGDGSFEPTPPLTSGLDASGICGEAADLDGDGLLDLVFAADPDNSGVATDPARYEDRVYRNTGAGGARANHWLRLEFSGIRDAALIGARVELREPGTGRLLGTRWIHANHSYKSGGALEAHFGLGTRAAADLRVVLPDGRVVEAKGVAADRYLAFDLVSGTVTPEEPR